MFGRTTGTANGSSYSSGLYNYSTNNSSNSNNSYMNRNSTTGNYNNNNGNSNYGSTNNYGNNSNIGNNSSYGYNNSSAHNFPRLGTYRIDNYDPDKLSRSMSTLEQWKSFTPNSVAMREETIHLTPV